MRLTLPYPPSVNHYWCASGKRRYISHAGRKFRRDSFYLIKAARCPRFEGDVWVSIELYPPDKRRRDVDNVLKPILDCLQYGGVITDDFQVSDLRIRRMSVLKCGQAVVEVKLA